MSNCSEIIGVQRITLYKNSGVRFVRPDVSVEGEVDVILDGNRSGDYVINEPVELPKWERIVNYSGNYKQSYNDTFSFLLHGINNDVPETIKSIRNNRLGYIIEILTTGNDSFIFPTPAFLNSENTKQIDSHSWAVSLSYRVPSFDNKLTSLIALVPRYRNVYESWILKPNNAVSLAQNSMVSDLVDAGIWDKLDLFYLFGGHTNDNGESLTNWISPGSFNAEISLTDTPLFASYGGFTGIGLSTSSHINTVWKQLFNAVNYTQDNASSGIYIRTNIDEDSFDFGTIGLFNMSKLQTRNSNTLYARINEDTEGSVANSDSRGLYVVARTGANLNQIYRNKSLLASPNTPSTGLSANNLLICSDGTVPLPFIYSSTKQISMFFTGSSLSQTEVDILTDAFEAYMDSNGKGVIP